MPPATFTITLTDLSNQPLPNGSSVTCRDATGNFISKTSGQSGVTTFTFGPCQPGSKYTLTIYAVNGVGAPLHSGVKLDWSADLVTGVPNTEVVKLGPVVTPPPTLSSLAVNVSLSVAGAPLAGVTVNLLDVNGILLETYTDSTGLGVALFAGIDMTKVYGVQIVAANRQTVQIQIADWSFYLASPSNYNMNVTLDPTLLPGD